MTARGRITITGITRREQPRRICRSVRKVPPGHRLVMSVLANAETIEGPAERSSRFAEPEEIGPIFAATRAAGGEPMLSYDLRPGEDLAFEVDQLVERVGIPSTWTQVNGEPSVEEVRDLCRSRERRGEPSQVVLQVTAPVLHRFEGRATERLAEWLAPYVDAGIAGILLDESAGHGLPLDVHQALRRLRFLTRRFPDLDHAVAGGLDRTNLRRLGRLLDLVPLLSVDVESGVRCAECDELLEEEAVGFVEAWLAVLNRHAPGHPGRG